MRLIAPACEDDMIAVFLAAEAGSARYGPRIRELLAGLGQPQGIAEHPDTGDAAANAVRRQVLAAYRGYPAGDVFTGMPADVAWHHAALTPAELATVRYLDYDYWTGFSGGTRLAADGARRLGPWQDQPPGSGYRRIAEDLRDGRLPPTIIVLGEPGPANLVVLEGHKRLTGLLVCPQWLPAEMDVMLGLTARHHK
jgi:hypothetical protein